jgi:HAD superfamily hydrolase (TIGR01549 family)
MKALIFDLDGTLVDSVYAHTVSWQQALAEYGMDVPAYQIHHRIGLSGRLLVQGIARLNRRRPISDRDIKRLEERRATLFRKLFPRCAPLPGAKSLLQFLRRSKIAHGIATTGKRPEIKPSLKALGIDGNTLIVDGTRVERAKPDADLFVECQQQLGFSASECLIVGDAIWDMHAAQRAGIFAIAVLTGGFSEQDLYNAGARRVYADAAELHQSLDELAVLP